MLDKRFKEAMELLGGRAVLKDGEEYFVVMSLREFRKIKKEGVEGLTKQELVDKINNDIAAWKFSSQEEQMNGINLEELEKAEEVRYEKTALE